MSVTNLREVAGIAKSAADRIQRILLDLDEELRAKGVRVDYVEVDTRRFGAMATNIVIESR